MNQRADMFRANADISQHFFGAKNILFRLQIQQQVV
jgi:hypothetical protein